MEKYLSSEGYDLIEVTNDEWILNVKGTPNVFTGSFRKIAKFAVERLGFKVEALNMAIEEYIKSQDEGHDAIHFDMNKTPLYTFKTERVITKKTYDN